MNRESTIPDENSPRQRRLGRGLNALLDATPLIAPSSRTGQTGDASSLSVRSPGHQQPESELALVNLDQITPNPYQPRSMIEPTGLDRLADSIRSSGVVQPIVVRRAGEGYELVAGERRWRAARMAGLTRVPAIVRVLTEQQTAEISIIENLQREDLNPIERGMAFKRLATEFGLTHAQIAERVGLERPTVANFVRLTELPPAIQNLIAAGRLSAAHGKALLSVVDPELRAVLAQRAVDEGWTTRRLERAAADAAPRSGAQTGGTAPLPRRVALVDLEKQLGDHLGTKVWIRADANGQRGRLVVEFYSLDHFDGLMFKFGFEPK